MPCSSTRCPGRPPYVLFPLTVGLPLMGSRSCCSPTPPPQPCGPCGGGGGFLGGPGGGRRRGSRVPQHIYTTKWSPRCTPGEGGVGGGGLGAGGRAALEGEGEGGGFQEQRQWRLPAVGGRLRQWCGRLESGWRAMGGWTATALARAHGGGGPQSAHTACPEWTRSAHRRPGPHVAGDEGTPGPPFLNTPPPRRRRRFAGRQGRCRCSRGLAGQGLRGNRVRLVTRERSRIGSARTRDRCRIVHGAWNRRNSRSGGGRRKVCAKGGAGVVGAPSPDTPPP